MPLDPQEPTHFELLPTPNVGQVSVLLWVRETEIRASTTISTGTTLSAFLPMQPKAGAINAGYGDYVLTATPAQKHPQGYLGYTFAKPVTSTAISTLTPYLTETRWLPMTWEPMLRTLYGLAGTVDYETESGLDGATATSNTRTQVQNADRYELIPGLPNHPTEVTVRHYLSPSAITGINVERQQPTRVTYRYLGMVNSLDCLHPEVRVPELLKNGQLINGFGTPNPDELDWSMGQVFPATVPMTAWRPHLYDAPMQLENGVYHLTTFTAKPPPFPKAIRIGE